MRRFAIGLFVLALIGASIVALRPARSGALVAQEAAAEALIPFTLRVSFGYTDAAPTDWDGDVRIENGRLDDVTGWRTMDRDAVGRGGWKIRTQRTMVAEGAPAPARPVTPSGVTVFGAGSEGRTRLRVTTPRGYFELSLAELRAARRLTRLDGAAEVVLLAASTRLTTDAREEDFPSIVEGRDGTVWAVWASFSGKMDDIRLRRYQKGAWATFTAVPGVEGDVWRPQVAVDGRGRPWVVWSEQIAGNWDIYARSLDGATWGEKIRLTSEPGPDIEHHLVGDAAGDLHVVWQGYRNGDFNIYLRSLRGGEWGPQTAVTEAAGSDWEPAVASDGRGRIAVVWDSYRAGDYDVFLRTWENGSWGKEVSVASSPYFEAHASVAIDPANRVWVAWEQGGAGWGKDQGYTIRDQRSGSVMGGPREIRLRCYAAGAARDPAVPPAESLPPAERQFLQAPKLAVDQDGHLWLHFRRRFDHRAEGGVARSIWQGHVTRLDGDRWMPAEDLPNSYGRISNRSVLVAGGAGNVWLAWPTDNRHWSGNSHIPVVNQVYSGMLAHRGPAVEPKLVDPRPETKPSLAAGHRNEPEDVRTIRAARTRLGGEELRIVRGDLHRHTELSWDNGGTTDSSLLDFYRYMIDAAAMDFGAVTDHQAGGDHLYSYWYIQKTTDLFHLADRYLSLYAYERSAVYPNGHRNIIHARRGIPVVSFFTTSGLMGDRPGVGTGALADNDTKLLYEILRRTGGISIPHTSATRMGTDWRDNDPAVEPVVEIFQGARTNYEYVGAPRSADPEKDAVHARQAGYESAGFVNLAWQKGYRLGTITSSDHGSTHISYALVYVTDFTREAVLDGIRKRRTYGATDNIILDFRIGDHFMGEEFALRGAPRLRIKVRGTADVARIVIRRNDTDLTVLQPGKREVDVSYEDARAETGVNRYYVRVEQSDGQLAWSSPIWIRNNAR